MTRGQRITIAVIAALAGLAVGHYIFVPSVTPLSNSIDNALVDLVRFIRHHTPFGD